MDKDGTDGEIETMKAYKAASDESEDAKPESDNVSSALIDKVLVFHYMVFFTFHGPR